MAKILFCGSGPDVADVVKDRLEEDLHFVEVLNDGASALGALGNSQFDLVILDQGTDQATGTSFCQQYRQAGGAAPVLMLTDKDKTQIAEFCPQEGADAYLTKPFEWSELHARIQPLLSRESQSIAEFAAGELVLDRSSCKVMKSGVDLHLLPKEFMMLECLMRNDRKVVSVDKLMDDVWGSSTAITAETVRSYIKTLRKKIDTPGKNSLIKNIYGMGYKLDATECLRMPGPNGEHGAQ
ncbi:MAG: response regulator transcription factor [Candidatus Obscuribacter sp.]|nr:response regulator transcription factor [Candidatus Obscuribacter sp.]